MILADLREIVAMPRGRQPEALDRLRRALPPAESEAWNTRFGPGSLFEAWTASSLMRGLYAANAATLRPLLDARPSWRVIEVGGGDGRLWRLLRPEDHGELVLVDPSPEAHAQVAATLPAGVRLVSHVAGVQDVDLPDADVIVCSLTLHHVAGADAAERAAHGLDGPGKREILAGFARALEARSGLAIVNEADVYCDIGLAPGDPILRERLIDSYVRRCAVALLDDLEASPDPRLQAIIQRWCLDQIAVADLPLAERDVYELDVPRWLALFERAGLGVEHRGFTDDHGLFCRYLLRPAQRSA